VAESLYRIATGQGRDERENDNKRRGAHPEDARNAIRNWVILLGGAAAVFLGTALLVTE
jgi:hypothetical protein